MEDGSTVSTRSVQARAELAARTVLLVEDDPALRTVVKLTLEAAGMEVTTAADGETALTEARTGRFAIVLLDLLLPALDGLEVCRRIRETSHVPIIVITALDSTGDVVSGLEAGADDYMTKPFEGPELVARIRALLRRSEPQSDEIRRVGDLEIDAAAHRLYKAGREVNLSAMEFRLLLVLSENVGHVLTRDVLLDRVWDYDYIGDSRLVDMAVKRLRAKIEDDPSNPQHVVTVRGVGYRLEAGQPVR
jgi:two-component system response regulator MtrA